MSDTLYLPLKRRWFTAFKYGDKEIEYRKITPTWVSRFLVAVWKDIDGVRHIEKIKKDRAIWYYNRLLIPMNYGE